MNSISILITGDFCPHKRIEKEFLNGNYDSVYNGFQKISNDCDLIITNLECPLTLSNRPIEKTGPNLKAHPDCINGIKYAGFNIVALANNHILDYGEQGLMDTMGLCSANNISYVGAGKNLREASKPLYKTINGIDIAIINFCENEWSIADKNKAGANPLNPISNYYQIKEAKEKADIVLVIVHGGHEHYKYPSPRMVDTYRFFADCGADAIIGHHTHIYSGYEVYNNVPIFYSLGNFLFDWENRPDSWHQGYLVSLKIKKNNDIKFELIPYKQCRKEVSINFFNDSEKEVFQENISNINEVISNRGTLQIEFEKFKDSKQKYVLEAFSTANIFSNRYLRAIIRRLKISKVFYRKQQLKTILNLVRCESHRDMIINVLDKYNNEANE